MVSTLAVLLLFLFGFSAAAATNPAPHAPRSVAERLGYPKDARLLLIQGEDLGMAHSVDNATLEALDKGWITTANVLVPGPWFPEVVRWSRSHPNTDLGVQLDLNSDWNSMCWRPISNQSPEGGLVDQFGWLPASDKYVAAHAKADAVLTEVRAQMEMARRAGLPISHIDHHMHVMLWSPMLFRAYWQMGRDYNLPIMLPHEQVRMRGTPTAKQDIYSLGGVDVDMHDFPLDRFLEVRPGLAQKDWLNAYEKTLESLPPGVYLLSVHLGLNDEELKAMTWDHPEWGAQWRQNDYDVVSSPEFHQFLKDKGFILIGWKELKKAIGEHP
jgi:chitin disaccharide deacetylase